MQCSTIIESVRRRACVSTSTLREGSAAEFSGCNTQTSFGFLTETGNQSVLDVLKAFLRNKPLLLVLDNFEHVVPAAPLMVELLQACPHLKILVTSRTLLRLSGEHEFLVSPLAVPDLSHLLATE